MEIKDGDVQKLNEILGGLVFGEYAYIIDDRAPEKFGIGKEEYGRLKFICLEHGAANDAVGDILQINENTANYLNANYFQDVCDVRQAERKESDMKHEQLVLNVRLLKMKWRCSVAVLALSVLLEIFRMLY